MVVSNGDGSDDGSDDGMAEGIVEGNSAQDNHVAYVAQDSHVAYIAHADDLAVEFPVVGFAVHLVDSFESPFLRI
jgi:hypothetical protein